MRFPPYPLAPKELPRYPWEEKPLLADPEFEAYELPKDLLFEGVRQAPSRPLNA
jgi:hypothetical protein